MLKRHFCCEIFYSFFFMNNSKLMNQIREDLQHQTKCSESEFRQLKEG
jgi:hypothetical protein